MKKLTWMAGLMLAGAVLTGCSSSDDDNFRSTVVDVSEVSISETDGSIVVPKLKTIAATDFIRCVSGHGWSEAETHEVNDDGTLQQKDYWEDMIGVSPSCYVFDDHTVTTFDYLDHVPCLAHFTTTFTYDETTNQVFFNGYYNFTVLSVSSSEIRIIKKGGVRSDPDSGGSKQVYLYVVLKRLSDKVTNELWEEYWVNGEDALREMTREDLMHKWVLTAYSNASYGWHQVTNDRRDDRYYLRFHSDGTFDGRAAGKSIKGTFEYADDGFRLVPADGVPTSGDFFLQYIWQARSAHIRSAAYLYLEVDNEQSFSFVRSPED